MTKAEKYIKDNPEYKMYLVDKKFGNGKQLIVFFYRNQVNMFKQGFLTYVDNQKWIKDHHAVMDEVEQYLIENEGVIDDGYFIETYNEDNNTNFTINDILENDEAYLLYKDWLGEQFPKIDLEYGGVCFHDAVSDI